MAEKYRVIHFINQFFAQIGGEEKADVPLSVTEGPVGPGLAFKMALQDEAEIVATFICGDNYFSEYGESIMQGVIARMGEYDPDIVIAGPAFNAGRYGPNCGALCKAVAEYLHIQAVTGMYEENLSQGLLYRADEEFGGWHARGGSVYGRSYKKAAARRTCFAKGRSIFCKRHQTQCLC